MTVASRSEVVNVATVPFRSPFRYPGGKTWLIPRIRQWLGSLQGINELIEPFAGGAIVSLTAIFEDLVKQATLVEMDEDIAAVWQTIFNCRGIELAEEIADFHLSVGTVQSLLSSPPENTFERAFATIIRNRVNRGGILAPGAGVHKNGENGRGLTSRWYPETIKNRILDIVRVKDRLHFIKGDGLEMMKVHANRTDAAFFIDPPYTVAGRRLYTHSCMDHKALFEIASELAGDFLMTYDDAEEIRHLARSHGFQMQLVPMKNTHHETKSELLIGRDLRWLQTGAQQITGQLFPDPVLKGFEVHRASSR